MQGLILAAGMGKRLKELTAGQPKCMVKANGISLAERMLRQLDSLGLSRILIVTGYRAEDLTRYVDSLGLSVPVEYIDNPVYETTNNIYSFYLAGEEAAREDTLLLESDLIFEEEILKGLVEDPRPSLAVADHYADWMDGTVLTLGEDDSIQGIFFKNEFREEMKDRYYKTVNIYKLDREFLRHKFLPFLSAYMEAMGKNVYYEAVLKPILTLPEPGIEAFRLSGQKWYEVDNVEDLRAAEKLFPVQ